MNGNGILGELRRRNVFKVCLAYAVIAWLFVALAALGLTGHDERKALLTALIVMAVIGLTLAIYISWAFEATPEGMKRTENVPSDAKLPTWSKRKFALFIMIIGLLAAVITGLDLVEHSPARSPAMSLSPSP